MRELKLLHIYSQTMDLYGDFSNLTEIRRRLLEMGHTCEIHCAELDEEIAPEGYDFVYMGHGKMRNLAAVTPHFLGYREKIESYIEAGGLMLVTGSARLLFGKSFTAEGQLLEGTGFFGYSYEDTGEVIVSDVVARPGFNSELRTYGFINRTGHMTGENYHPLFAVEQGLGDGETDSTEGTLYKNFFATWQMGPILLRNPELLIEMLRRMLGDDYRDIDTGLAEKALELTLTELK